MVERVGMKVDTLASAFVYSDIGLVAFALGMLRAASFEISIFTKLSCCDCFVLWSERWKVPSWGALPQL